jgi:transketolase
MNRHVEDIKALASRMRKHILDVSFACNGSAHLGGGLSIVEIMAVLYGAVLRLNPAEPEWEDRDRFILSKGHGVLGYYPALLEAGFFGKDVFDSFKTNDSDLIAHPVMNLKLGIESSNGSLGHGLSLGVGLAWAAKRKKRNHRIFVLLGDGECNEGSVWEAAMSASHYKLGNLVAIVDYNKLQSDGASERILNSDGLPDKWRAFRWNTVEIDGHNVEQLLDALSVSGDGAMPTAVIAHTVKGKGVSFMEGNNEWHHNRLTKAFYEQALAEVMR